MSIRQTRPERWPSVTLIALGAMLLTACAIGAPPRRRPSPRLDRRARLDGVVDNFTADYISRERRGRRRWGAAAVLVEIDTPGGLGSSMDQIIDAFLARASP